MKPSVLLISISLIASAINLFAHEEGHAHIENPRLIIEPSIYFNNVVGHTELANSGLARGGHDPAGNGFSIPSINLSTAISYGEYLTAFTESILLWNEDDGWEYELEELYLKGVNLPGGIEIKAGRLLPAVGARNNIHNHAWKFVDNQLGNVRFLGADGLIVEGTELSWTPTTRWDDQFFISFGNAIEHEESEGGSDNEEAESALWDSNIFTVRYESTFWPSNTHNYRLGASYAQGDNFFNETSRLYGADLTYLWLQDEDLGKKLTWINEAALRDISTGEDNFTEFSFSSMANYSINHQWEIGLRYDFLQGANELDLPERHRISPTLTRQIRLGSVDTAARLQYNYDHSEEQNDDHSIWFQLAFGWGAGGSGHSN